MKRFWITIGVLLGCALLFCVGLGVILALAPGSRIFGITYVSASVGKANLSEEWMDSVSGDIFIQTREIPVELSFEPYGKFKVEFVQEYNNISPALLIYFKDGSVMPIREHKFLEYVALIDKNEKFGE